MRVRIGTFTPEEIFSFIPDKIPVIGKIKHFIKIDGKEYRVKISSYRLVTFKHNPCCVSCGICGSFFALENTNGETPHLEFYAISDGKEVLMTKDHIIPVSRGGKDHLDNYQTMCCVCNSAKGNNINNQV
jgi:5-methylcytosine-specific restriction endonuclease McrA